MKKIIILLIFLSVASVFYPKESGGPLCGPVCYPDGLHYWEKDCIDFEKTNEVIDSYTTYCFGLTIGEKKCFGIPYESNITTDIEMECDYPCHIQKIKDFCSSNPDSHIFGEHCSHFKKQCGW